MFAFFRLPHVIGFPRHLFVALVGVVEPRASLGLIVTGVLVVVTLCALGLRIVRLAQRRQPIVTRDIEAKGVQRAVIVKLKGHARRVEVVRTRSVAARTIADDAFGPEGHLLTTNLHIHQVKEVGILEVEVVDEEHVGKTLLALIALGRTVIAEFIRHAQEEFRLSHLGPSPHTCPQTQVITVSLFAMLFVRHVIRGVIT